MTLDSDTQIEARALTRLTERIARSIDAGEYDGAVVAIAHRGEIVAHEAIGYAERDTDRPARRDDVFRILSITKAFTTNLVFQAIEQGKLSFSTKVVEVIPEFRSADRFLNKRKDRISVTDLLTHRSALPPTPEPLPTHELGSLSRVIERVCEMDAIGEPGKAIEYSPLFNHALLGEMVRRVQGAESYRQLAQRDIFDPLGMTNTAIGAAKRLQSRLVPLRARFEATGWLSASDIESLNTTLDEQAEMPWVGAVSTAGDLLRFAEMLRRGGELNGVRLVSPAILDRATRNLTARSPHRARSATTAPARHFSGWTPSANSASWCSPRV